MADLTREQRRALETTIKAAREEAEIAAAEALRGLRVPDAPAGFDAARKEQRERLRAHAKALGDARTANGAQGVVRLTEQAAYVQWHRLLFARFLVERGLLRDETGAQVSLTDCREIALDLSADEDEWSVASGFAAGMLPGIFPGDDPVASLRLTRERGRELRNRLLSIDPAVFQADDSLGWTYQFWRAAEKKAVNDSQVKIGAAELPAVTQLFTEPYMVRFLLHNTLGAWWAGKVLAGETALRREAVDETALRKACALPGYAWEFLRFVQEDGVWRPAAGIFPGWPAAAKALSVLDPCCGSGHFLTEALAALTALRVADEGLSPADGVAAVLRDNLAGLEIDGRCVQIAAFNLALAGWRIGGHGTVLPTPNVAWVGAPPPLPRTEFAALANGNADLRRGLEALHDLFSQAPLLGSLIEPMGGDLADLRRVAQIESSIAALVERMRGAEPERIEGAVAARGLADAALILARRWTLQATNVPFLGNLRYSDSLASFVERRFAIAGGDLATVMLDRLLLLCDAGGTLAAVTKGEWCFLSSFKDFRRNVLATNSLNALVTLGEEAWEYFGKRGPLATLCVLTEGAPSDDSSHFALDSTDTEDRAEKIARLCSDVPTLITQAAQTRNPDSRIAVSAAGSSALLSRYARSLQGISPADVKHYGRYFWEVPERAGFVPWQSAPESVSEFRGREMLLWYGADLRSAIAAGHAYLRGEDAWMRRGVAVRQLRDLACTIYTGDAFDTNVAVIVPTDDEHVAAIWAFCSSDEFRKSIRRIDQKKNVTNATMVKVPFDLDRWQRVAATAYPDGLPEPYSDDPTQWVFHGHPRFAAPGTELHVALARLAGYRWPAETDPTMRVSAETRVRIAKVAALPPADADGLLPLSPLLGERALADRLYSWCAAAWGKDWSADTEAALVAAACERAKDKPPRSLTIDAWLRAHAARQHAKLFHDRPFLWWITDGRADGFTAVVHYHRLTRDALSRLAFHVLGNHLTRLGDNPGAEAARILQRKLERIIEGEPPFDIFVRWKSLRDQPLGWDPDLDDGVRLNIRPFIEAGVLVHVPNVKYTVDGGKDVASAPWYSIFGGERRNDHHTTLAEKREARAKAKA